MSDCYQKELCQARYELYQTALSGESEGERLATIATLLAASKRPCGALCQPYINALNDLLKWRQENL